MIVDPFDHTYNPAKNIKIDQRDNGDEDDEGSVKYQIDRFYRRLKEKGTFNLDTNKFPK